MVIMAMGGEIGRVSRGGESVYISAKRVHRRSTMCLGVSVLPRPLWIGDITGAPTILLGSKKHRQDKGVVGVSLIYGWYPNIGGAIGVAVGYFFYLSGRWMNGGNNM
jgi:hypothetical protein